MQLKPVSYAMIAAFACGIIVTAVGSYSVLMGS